MLSTHQQPKTSSHSSQEAAPKTVSVLMDVVVEFQAGTVVSEQSSSSPSVDDAIEVRVAVVIEAAVDSVVSEEFAIKVDVAVDIVDGVVEILGEMAGLESVLSV